WVTGTWNWLLLLQTYLVLPFVLYLFSKNPVELALARERMQGHTTACTRPTFQWRCPQCGYHVMQPQQAPIPQQPFWEPATEYNLQMDGTSRKLVRTAMWVGLLQGIMIAFVCNMVLAWFGILARASEPPASQAAGFWLGMMICLAGALL